MRKGKFKTRRRFLKESAVGMLGLLHGGAIARAAPQLQPVLNLRSGGLTLAVSERGALVTSHSLGNAKEIKLSTALEGYVASIGPKFSKRNSGIERRNSVVNSATDEHCELVEFFSAGVDGIRWELEVHSVGALRSAPIHMIAAYPATPETKFWTAWSAPEDTEAHSTSHAAAVWQDPLTLMPVASRKLYYGAPYFTYEEPRIAYTPGHTNLMAIPLASFHEQKLDAGFSMMVSPEAGDGLLDLTLDTANDGSADFTFFRHRLNPNRPVKLAADLIAHQADWRPALHWMTKRYASYFTPPMATAQALDGTAAYSTDKDPSRLDAEKLKRMAFRVNWKASFDFPYMGMFLPPVDKESWPRFSGDSGGNTASKDAHPNGTTSLAEMAEYSVKMREAGFYTLNYFNVTEFGANVTYPAPPRVAKSEDDLWKNPNDFIYGRLKESILHVPAEIPQKVLSFYPHTKTGGPYFTWGNGIILDCGEPEYQEFLLAQSERHIKKLPASSGICIDRMDWLRLYNDRRDDGVSWLGEKPTQSLYVSWKQLMSKLLPRMHAAGKSVFVNNHVKRFDLLKDIDGIFDEFSMSGSALNLTALLAVSRPALGWVNDEKSIRNDPDGFFQRFLYLGVFPMAPFPGNDHAIRPDEWADAQYLEYGPLMNAMHGRQWVLDSHAVSVPGGEAIANLFSIGDGYVVPVMMGKQNASAKLKLGKLARLDHFHAQAIHPGSDTPVAINFSTAADHTLLDVPLVRGCAMVQIQKMSYGTPGTQSL